MKEVNVQEAIKHRGVIQTLGLVGLHTAFLQLLLLITQLDQIHEILNELFSPDGTERRDISERLRSVEDFCEGIQ